MTDLRDALDLEYQRGFSDGLKAVTQDEMERLERNAIDRARRKYAKERQAIVDAAQPLIEALEIWEAW